MAQAHQHDGAEQLVIHRLDLLHPIEDHRRQSAQLLHLEALQVGRRAAQLAQGPQEFLRPVAERLKRVPGGRLRWQRLPPSCCSRPSTWRPYS